MCGHRRLPGPHTLTLRHRYMGEGPHLARLLWPLPCTRVTHLVARCLPIALHKDVVALQPSPSPSYYTNPPRCCPLPLIPGPPHGGPLPTCLLPTFHVAPRSPPLTQILQHPCSTPTPLLHSSPHLIDDGFDSQLTRERTALTCPVYLWPAPVAHGTWHTARGSSSPSITRDFPRPLARCPHLVVRRLPAVDGECVVADVGRHRLGVHEQHLLYLGWRWEGAAGGSAGWEVRGVQPRAGFRCRSRVGERHMLRWRTARRGGGPAAGSVGLAQQATVVLVACGSISGHATCPVCCFRSRPVYQLGDAHTTVTETPPAPITPFCTGLSVYANNCLPEPIHRQHLLPTPHHHVNHNPANAPACRPLPPIAPLHPFITRTVPVSHPTMLTPPP